jgi:YD repeat-containing protein
MDGMLRVQTNYGYVYESALPYASSFKNANRVNEKNFVYTYQKDFDNKVFPRAKAEYSYRYSNYAYRLDSVRAWEDINRDSLITPNEMITQKVVSSYDIYGNPLSIRNADGTLSDFEWSGTYKNSRLTKSTVYNGGISMVRTYTYNPLYLLQSQTDENNITTNYHYDNLGRLKKINGPGGITLKEYFYNFKNQVNNPSVPLNWLDPDSQP